MKEFLAFQDSIYRTYALIEYNSTSTKKLKKEEREQLEVVLRVDEGSSKFLETVTGAVEIINKSLSKMESKHILILGSLITVCYFGNSAYKAHLQNTLEIRKKEIEYKKDGSFLDAINFLSQEGTKKMELLKQVAEQYGSKEEQILKNANKGYNAFLKGATDTDNRMFMLQFYLWFLLTLKHN